MFKVLTLIPILGMLGCASSSQEPPGWYAYEYGRPLAPYFHSIKIEDKIDAREADVLATLYFLRYDGFCGANSPVFQKGRKWYALTAAGPTGSADADIVIDSTSGVVRQKGHPDSSPPWDDLRDVLNQPVFKDRVDGSP